MPARIVATQYITLDGVIEDPVGMENSGLGDWTGGHRRGPVGDAFKEHELLEASALILGRRTYDAFAAVWPTLDTPYAAHMNAMPKHLASRTVSSPSWSNTQILPGDLAPAVAGLKAETRGTILIFGSASVCHQLLGAGLVDELSLILYPVVVGRGLRLLPDALSARFHLIGNQTLNDGLVLLRYGLSG